MNFICEGCKQEKDPLDCCFWLIPADGKSLLKYCRFCRTVKASLPDVYFDGKPEEGLADDPNTGKPRVFNSRGEKAAYLKERGLQEAGDRVGGSYVLPKNSPRRTIDEARRVLAEVNKMGREYRKQEYRRIIKEGRHER